MLMLPGSFKKGALSKGIFEPRKSNGSESFFPFDISWHHQICIARGLYSLRDDLPENIGKTTTQAECKKSTRPDLGWHASWKMSSK